MTIPMIDIGSLDGSDRPSEESCTRIRAALRLFVETYNDLENHEQRSVIASFLATVAMSEENVFEAAQTIIDDFGGALNAAVNMPGGHA